MSEPKFPPRSKSQLETTDVGKLAEKALIDIMKRVPGIDMRPATPREDSGKVDIGKGTAIDAVGFKDHRHAFVVQVTTASDRDVLNKKRAQMENKLFVPTSELEEGQMKDGPSSIPRFQVTLDVGSILKLAALPGIENHPDLEKKVLDLLVKNVQLFLLLNAKSTNKGELDRLRDLKDLFTSSLAAVR